MNLPPFPSFPFTYPLCLFSEYNEVMVFTSSYDPNPIFYPPFVSRFLFLTYPLLYPLLSSIYPRHSSTPLLSNQSFIYEFLYVLVALSPVLPVLWEIHSSFTHVSMNKVHDIDLGWLNTTHTLYSKRSYITPQSYSCLHSGRNATFQQHRELGIQ